MSYAAELHCFLKAFILFFPKPLPAFPLLPQKIFLSYLRNHRKVLRNPQASVRGFSSLQNPNYDKAGALNA